MDHFTVDPLDSTPPFEQLRRQIASRAASGGLPPGTRLPTVRNLAQELGVAVNTVARTYKELEADGVVVTEGRRGTFVAASAAADASGAVAAAARYAAVARGLGLGLPEATRLLEQSWHPPAASTTVE